MLKFSFKKSNAMLFVYAGADFQFPAGCREFSMIEQGGASRSRCLCVPYSAS